MPSKHGAGVTDSERAECWLAGWAGNSGRMQEGNGYHVELQLYCGEATGLSSEASRRLQPWGTEQVVVSPAAVYSAS